MWWITKNIADVRLRLFAYRIQNKWKVNSFNIVIHWMLHEYFQPWWIWAKGSTDFYSHLKSSKNYWTSSFQNIQFSVWRTTVKARIIPNKSRMPTPGNSAERTTILFSIANRYSHLHLGKAGPTLQIQEHGINITINQIS